MNSPANTARLPPLLHFVAPTIVVLFAGVAASVARAELVSLEITSRAPYAEGRPIGDVGPCERLRGTARFALDPKLPANQIIVDLGLCPLNADGRVEFSAEVDFVLAVDRAKCNGALFYEVNNRGKRTALNTFDGGVDHFLLRQGFIVAWSGWIAEVHPGDDRLTMVAPVPTENGKSLRGIVRQEVIVDKAVPQASVMHRPDQGAYRPAADELPRATLTRRVLEADERQPVPRDQWELIVSEVDHGGRPHTLPKVELKLQGGLEPGVIYEVIYTAEGSLVQGAGLAGIRDLVAFLRLEARDKNPLRGEDGKPLVTRTLGFGTSQSGRLLRHFLFDGFNADEHGRRVFDGVMPHVAGGGLGWFNHRFCSPTRTNGQHEEHDYPVDMFPFAYEDQFDPVAPVPDGPIPPDEGVLTKARAADVAPKVMHTQSSSEYWHRSGSLVHTTPAGVYDAKPPAEVRFYTFGGTRHSAGSGFAEIKTLEGLPGYREGGQLPSNPADYRPLMRGLLMALDAWVRDGVAPPPSVYPKRDDKTLVHFQAERSGWPSIPGVRYPEVIQRPSLYERGPDWQTRRITSIEPPKQSNAAYGVLVPAFGPDGNELGCLNLPTLAVPVATYTPWNLRSAAIGAEGELLGLQGGYIPFAKTKADREQAGDPRPALLERYRDYGDYQNKLNAAAEKLAAERYLLEEDLPRIRALGEKHRSLFE